MRIQEPKPLKLILDLAKQYLTNFSDFQMKKWRLSVCLWTNLASSVLTTVQGLNTLVILCSSCMDSHCLPCEKVSELEYSHFLQVKLDHFCL